MHYRMLLLILMLLWGGTAEAQRRRKVSSLPKHFTASSPDSRFFAVDYFVKRFEAGGFTYYNMVRVYHVRSRRYISNLKFLSVAEPDWLRFSPDGKKVLLKTGLEHLLLDVRTRKRQQKIQKAACVGFIEGGRQLVAQEGNILNSYETSAGKLTTAYQGLPTNTKLDTLTESPDQHWLIGLGEGECFLWKQGHKALERRFKASDIIFTPDGKLCLVLSYKNSKCYITTYDARNFQKVKEINCDIYRDITQFVFTSGNSISPDAKYVAFCAKRYGETRSIGVYDWAQQQLLLDIDSVDLGNRQMRMLEQPYRWQVEEDALLVDLEGDSSMLVPLDSSATQLYSQVGRFNTNKPSPSGKLLTSFTSSASKFCFIRKADGSSKEELIPAKFLAYSPNNEFMYVLQDSLYGFIKTASVGTGKNKFFPFATTPYLPGQEDVIENDAIAPEGHEHIYLGNYRHISELPEGANLRMEHKSVVSNGDTVGIQVHLLDDEGNYYYGADSLIWCELEVKKGNSDSIYTMPRSRWQLSEVMETDTLPMALAIVMDHSGSMGDARAYTVQAAVDSLIHRKSPRDTIALLKYDGRIGVESALASDGKILLKRLQKDGLGGYGGGTALLDALSEAVNILRPASNYPEKAILVFTDGEENSSVLTQGELLQQAYREKVHIYTVGFGASVDTTFLQRIAKVTGGSAYQIYDTYDFQRIFKDAYRRMRSYYQIDIPADTLGWHTYKLKLCLPTGEQTLLTHYRHRIIREADLLEDVEELDFPEGNTISGEDSLYFSDFDSPPEEGAIKLLNVRFHFDKTTMTSASAGAIDSAVAYMKKYPAIAVELRGHTDATGNDAYNLDLSHSRAEGIKELLIARGIDASRLIATGYGESKPIAPNSTKAGRASNRRTEFVVVSKGAPVRSN